MPLSAPARFVALGAVTATLALALTVAPATSVTPTASAAAADGTCLPGYGVYPNLNASATSRGTDTEVNAYIGNDFFTLAGASEGEGVFVIGHDFWNQVNYFNIGTAGSGSRVEPPAMSDMLTVGRTIRALGATMLGTIDVGHGVGGNVVAGGSIGPAANSGRVPVETNGGTQRTGVSQPLAPYTATQAGFVAQSTAYTALNTTGTVAVTGYDVTFTGDGTSTRQVFSVDGTQLGAIGATKTMNFAGIPTDAIVVVNVIGSNAVIGANTFSLNGTSIVPTSTTDLTFSHFTQSLVWNFPTATSVMLGDGDQLLGSILVPTANSQTTMLTSTNGRIYAAGNLTMGGGSQTGLEIHNYGFRGEIGCADAQGSLSIAKTIADTDSVADESREYTGTYSCGTGTGAITGTWSLRAGGAPFVTPEIPTGTTCTIDEDDLTSAPAADDPSYVWLAPTITPSTVVVPNAATPVAVTVTNRVDRLVGDFAVRKALADPFEKTSLTRAYTGTFECSYNGTDVTPAPGTWSALAGQSKTLATDLPVGAECSVTEDALTAPPVPGELQYRWRAPTFSAESVTVANGATASITVTNVVYDPTDISDDTETDDGDDNGGGGNGDSAGDSDNLAHTGSDIALPLSIAGGTVVLGAALFFIARRRRLRNHA